MNKYVNDKIYKFYNDNPKYTLNLKYGKLFYEVKVYRRLTIIRGKSARGKSILLTLLTRYLKAGGRYAENIVKGWKNKIEVNSNVDIVVEPDIVTADMIDKLIFFDEDNVYIHNKKILSTLLNDGYYIVVITRDNFCNMTYPISELYNRSDNRIYRMYDNILPYCNDKHTVPLKLEDLEHNIKMAIIEDSNTGFDVYSKILERINVTCTSSYGKDNIIPIVRKLKSENNLYKTLIILDGANFGQNIKELMYIIDGTDTKILTYESFEFLVLCSLNIFDNLFETVVKNKGNILHSQGYNIENIFNEILLKATLYMDLTKTSSSYSINNVIQDVIKNSCTEDIEYNITYSKLNPTKNLFTNERVKEIEEYILRGIKSLNTDNNPGLEWR